MTTTTGTRIAFAYARGLLAVSVILSLGCNAAHAYLNAAAVPILLAVGVGTIPPLILALSVEAVIFCAAHARKSLGWVAVIVAAAAGLVTGFAMSFAAISELGRMARMTAVTAPMLPIGIDALVITGLGMVALFRPRHEEAVHQGAVTDAVTAPAAPAQQLATPPVTGPVEQLITTEDEVITAPIPTAQFGDQEPVTSEDAAGDYPGEPAAHQDAQVIPLVSKAGHQDQVSSGHLLTGDHEPAAQPMRSRVVRTSQLPTDKSADGQSAGEQQIDPERDAQVLKERGARLPEQQLTDLIARIAAGESYSSIAEATGISRNTVRKVAGQVPTEPEPVPVA